MHACVDFVHITQGLGIGSRIGASFCTCTIAECALCMRAVQWTLYGTIGSQLGDVGSMITVEGQTMTVAEYIGGVYGWRHDGLWIAIVVLLGFCVLFWLVIAGTPLQPFLCSPYCVALVACGSFCICPGQLT